MDSFRGSVPPNFFSFCLGKQLTESTTSSDQTAGDHPVTALSQGPAAATRDQDARPS